MEIVKQFDTKVKIWEHDSAKASTGQVVDWVGYELGITPPEPRDTTCCYFNVWVERKYEEKGKTIFRARTYTCFLVRYNNHTPSCEFFFRLIEKAVYEFGKIFHQRIRQTNLQNESTEHPRFDDLKNDIQNCIDIWDKAMRNTSVN